MVYRFSKPVFYKRELALTKARREIVNDPSNEEKYEELMRVTEPQK